MAISSPFYRAPEPARDWTWRLPPNRAGVEADPGMEIRPPDGSYSMRRVGEENLTQMPGQEVTGSLPANALTHPLLLELLRQRRDLAKHFMQQNQLMMPQ